LWLSRTLKLGGLLVGTWRTLADDY
jgi:hypothetical protein